MKVAMEKINNKVHSFVFVTALEEIPGLTIELGANTDCNLKRSDSKVILKVDDDSVINHRYKWVDLYYEPTAKIRLPESIIYIANNKYLEQSLNKIFSFCNINTKQISYMMPFILQDICYKEGEIIKCEIFNSDSIKETFKTNYVDVASVTRFYFRFSFVEKKGRDVINTKYIPKTGNLRISEFIFDIM